MNVQLISTIDAYLDFLRERDGVLTCSQLKELDHLADEVYKLASKAGLSHALPQAADLRAELDLPGSPVTLETKLNLPGDWDFVDRVEYEQMMARPLRWEYSLEEELPKPPERHFVLSVPRSWYKGVFIVRELAMDKITADQDSKQKTKEKRRGIPLEEVAAKLDRIRRSGDEWTSQSAIAKVIGCSADTVNKALHGLCSEDTKRWAGLKDDDNTQPTTARAAVRLNDILVEEISQTTELTPEDYARIKEFEARTDLTEEDRAALGACTTDQQRLVLIDQWEDDRSRKVHCKL